MPSSVPRVLDTGALDVYNFQKHLPPTAPETEAPVRKLKVEWAVPHHSIDGPRLPDLRIPIKLKLTSLPATRTEDDRQDDVAYQNWLHRIEDADEPYDIKFYETPSIGNMAIYIFACFQQQLLLALPATVRANTHHPEQEGDPYIKISRERNAIVTQNLMRESFSGLPARLTRFVATQYTVTSWINFAHMFFPTTVEQCANHPGWLEPGMTYLDMRRRLLERVESLSNSKEIQDLLADFASLFVRSFKVLPDLTGGPYTSLGQKGPGGRRFSIWDDTSFEKSATAKSTNFQPRWMTINKGGRISNRIRLAYTFTDKTQIRYMGGWQDGKSIQDTNPNFGKRYPSPVPFEHAWMVDNYHTILSERAYMVLRKEVTAAHFLPSGTRTGIGHDYWHPQHDAVSCTECRTWNVLNPSSLEDDEHLDIVDPNTYNMGDKSWGYFACESERNAVVNVAGPKKGGVKRRRTGRGTTAENCIDVDAAYYV
ncbi:hypothetical protein QFC21_005589 [Naganishia friedmannii]|uniref:Uncharacterized protein n=1 Tax=Naganishia friedmannii TaxID=89922 RepID=A0ACC2VAX1_9TREE|nr:hypothetical protein QFC21_005589 [Naganishia friedmannii]